MFYAYTRITQIDYFIRTIIIFIIIVHTRPGSAGFIAQRYRGNARNRISAAALVYHRAQRYICPEQVLKNLLEGDFFP